MKYFQLLLILFGVFLQGCSSDSGTDSANDAVESHHIYPSEIKLSEMADLVLPKDDEYVTYYPFYPEANKTYSVDAVNSVASDEYGNIWVQLVDKNFNPITENILITRGGIASFDYQSPSIDVMYIAVIGNSQTHHFYRFSLLVSPSTQDGLVHDANTYEPNNTFASALEAVNGGVYDSLVAKDDVVDFYFIYLNAGEVIDSLLMNKLTALSSPSIYIQYYDEALNPLTDALKVGFNSEEQHSYAANKDRLIYIKVFHLAPKEIPYQLQINIH